MKWSSTSIRQLLLVIIISLAMMIPSGAVLAGDSPTEGLQSASGLDGSGGRVYQLTLITGDMVSVMVAPDGERRFAVTLARPEKLGQHFLTIEQEGDTYIIPGGIDWEKLDVGLFNIDYLIDEQYYEQPGLPLIVRYSPALDGTEVESLEDTLTLLGTGIELHGEVNAISTILDYKDISTSYDRLIVQPEVEKIWLDKKMYARLSESVPLIGAPSWWEAGYTGTGVAIAVLDTGIDSSHPSLDDLDDDPVTADPKVLVNVNFTDDTGFEDLYGHGTHVAGIAAGTYAGSGYQGVAPGANLWNVKVLNQYGWGYESWILNGISFASLGPDGVAGSGDEADIINISLGTSYKGGSDPVSQAVNWAVEQGVVVAVSAGNSGPAPTTVGTPGVAENAITVGASDKSDVIADFSSRGPTLDARIKPDILAPGVGIVSSVPGGAYGPKSGTSMAAPHVAGAAALLLEAVGGEPPSGLTLPRFVKDALMCSAEDLDYSVYEQGSGRLDLDTCWGVESETETVIEPGELAWEPEALPGTAGLVLQPDDITDVAVAGDGTTIWAAPGPSASDNIVFRSTDTGYTWTAVETSAGGVTGISPSFVAVAPDNTDYVAIATAAGPPLVYITTDGGTTWDNLGIPTGATSITDIDISASGMGANHLFVAGTIAGPLAEVWYYQLGIGGSWVQTGALGGGPGAAGHTKALAVKASPNFPSDTVAMVVTTDGTNTFFNLFSRNASLWNANAAVFGSNYPVTLMNGAASITSQGVSIAPAPTYLGGDEVERVAFVGINDAGGANGGVYRLLDTNQKAIKTGIDIYSVAYNGITVVAGSTGWAGIGPATVWRSSDPLDISPVFYPTAGTKSPGGCQNAVVAWAGNNVVAGTSGNENAFSVSTDEGASFNDISLINTTIASVEDVAVSPDGNIVYVLTDDGADVSLWRKSQDAWQRVLSLINASGLPYIVRIAPDNDNVVYAASTASNALYYSKEGGDTKWYSRTSPAVGGVTDMALESEDVAYVAMGNTVQKTNNGGFTWGTPVNPQLVAGNIATITSPGEDLLIVGGNSGYVSYSADGGSTWHDIQPVIEPGALATQVTATGLDNGDYIFAASSKPGSRVVRWQIGTSTEWEDIIGSNIEPGYGVYGIGLNEGNLYVLGSDGINSKCWWTPDPTAPSPEWYTINGTGMVFNRSPQALKTSSGKLWAIDTSSQQLFSCTHRLVSHISRDVLVTPASLSLGEFGWENPAAGGMLTFLNGNDARDVTLTAELIDVLSGIDYSGYVTLNPTSFTLPAEGEVDVSLEVDLAGLPASVYSGKVIASIDGGTEWTVHAILGFSKVCEVNIHKIDIIGAPAQEHPVWILTEAPSLSVSFAGNTDESGNLTFATTASRFHVLSYGTDEISQASIWTIQEDVIVSGDTYIELDERDTRVIDFDPDKSGQIPSAKEVELFYLPESWSVRWDDSWWYPDSFITRVSPASKFAAGFNYNYYPVTDFLSDNPQLVNTGELHNLVFPVVYLSDDASLQTRLLAVMSPSINSIADLNNGKIAVTSNRELDWLQAALAAYGISYVPVTIPQSDIYIALLKGVVNAVLVTGHPCPYLEDYISEGTVRLLPWSPEAVNAVVSAYPQDVNATELPANTYQGQTEGIPGYAPKFQPPVADYDNLVHLHATYSTALADERAYWRQQAYDDRGGWWSGFAYLMDAPQERWEWLSPSPVRYSDHDYYKAEPEGEWYFDSPGFSYEPGEYGWGMGGHPLTSGVNIRILSVPQPVPAPPPASMPMAEEEYYLDIWGYIFKDTFNNNFGNFEGPVPVPVPVPAPPPSTIIESSVSTPMPSNEGSGNSDNRDYESEDINNAIGNYSYQEGYAGHITVHQDGAIVLDQDVEYYIKANVDFENTADFTVEVWGETPLALSRESYTRLDFTADPGRDSSPPQLLFQVPGIDTHGTVPDGEVTVRVLVTEDSLIDNVDLLYSLDDEDTWTAAGSPDTDSGWYKFNLGELQDTYVSFQVDAEDEYGNHIQHTVYRAFYVGEQGVEVSVNAPDTALPGEDFTASVDIANVVDLNVAQYDILFDPLVLEWNGVDNGQIGPVTMGAVPSEVAAGHWRVVQYPVPVTASVSGSGCLATLNFRAIGALDTSSNIIISDGSLVGNEGEIPATWTGDRVTVSGSPGDANSDGRIDSVDLVKVLRIILGEDPPNFAADANQDGNIDSGDLLKVLRIILGVE